MSLQRRALNTPQNDVLVLFVSLTDAAKATGTQTTAMEGQGEATIVRNSAGNYTITPVRPGNRIVNVGHPVPTVAGLSCQLVSKTNSTNAVVIEFTDDTVATDTGFDIAIAISYDILRR